MSWLAKKSKDWFIVLRVGMFLAVRYVRRSSFFTSGLTIFIMILTFLNLVVISGILVGLIEGSSIAYRQQYSADALITPRVGTDTIEQTPALLQTIRTIPGFVSVSPRYVSGGRISANYQQAVNNPNEKQNDIGTEVVGIDPIEEMRTTTIGDLVIDGEFLAEGDDDVVVLGAELIQKYSQIPVTSFATLSKAEIGDKVLLTIDGVTREVRIKGVIKSKIGQVNLRAYMPAEAMRKMLNRSDFSVDEIAIKLDKNTTSESAVSALKASGFEQYADIKTWEDSQGTFFGQIKTTFGMLGNLIGSIGLVVASITVFIVIFITAITRRKYIGIMKGIGVSGSAIELSYVFLSIFYAVIGIGLGAMILFFVIQPYIDLHPINFPFSDGILVATYSGTAIRSGLIMLATIIAGYIPARLIVKRNTLDAILGR